MAADDDRVQDDVGIPDRDGRHLLVVQFPSDDRGTVIEGDEHIGDSDGVAAGAVLGIQQVFAFPAGLGAHLVVFAEIDLVH